MTTTELKQYIDKVLGNSIRCLLPSYWWKRLFNQVADRIDEVGQSASELVESKVEEAKMPIVESVDELSKLDLPKGGVAAVEKVGEPVVVNLEDCYLSGDVATDWDKYTVIRRFSEKGVPSNAVGQISLFSDKSMENGLSIACGEGKYFYYKIANGGTYYSSLEEVNEYLASGKYRLVVCYFIENISAYVTLYSEIPQPSLYIKGDSWERFAKESDLEGVGASITIDSELSETSENPVQNKVITAALNNKVDKVNGKQLSTEDFTSALKAKLEGLSNYDDTSIQNAVNSLTTQINTLVSGDASAAIESFNEIIAFLNGVEDSENLDSIIASIEQQIAAVARVIPTKVSELDNDEGYLTEHQDVSGKLDKTEAASTYLTKADAQTTYLGINGKAKSAEWADKATQATRAVQDAAGRNLTVTYATKAELNNKQDTISDLATIRSGAALGATALQSIPSEYSPTLDVLKAVYPVGAIYISTVATSPQTLFGFGAWERIQDRFLLSAGSSYDAGSTGGEATHTLTKNETPAHTHTRGTMEIYGALTERPCSSSAEILNSKADGAFKSTMKGDDLQWGVTVQTSGSSTHNNNLHEFIASRNWTGETSSVGGGAAHNNMPPYLAVYMWKRTA